MVRPIYIRIVDSRAHTSRCRYSTGSNLNTYSALIQNFYTQETAPHQAIHLAINTGVEEGQQAGVKAYVGCVVIPGHTDVVRTDLKILVAPPSA